MVRGKKQDSLTSEPRRCAEVAQGAIAQTLDQLSRYYTLVLADQDPEPLHQMRVNLRRLRTLLVTFEVVLGLPRERTLKQIRKLNRVLGAVRDLDVLHEGLKSDYGPLMPKSEQAPLRELRQQLKHQRKQRFRKLHEALEQALEPQLQNESQSSPGAAEGGLKQSIEAWLADSPGISSLGDYSVEAIAPDLLLPLLSQLFLHPGLHLPIPGRRSSLQPEQVRSLHQLRKQVKSTRYPLELLREMQAVNAEELLALLKDSQKILGKLQDLAVCREFAEAVLDQALECKMPTFAQRLHQQQTEILQAWKPLQCQWVDPEVRARLRQI